MYLIGVRSIWDEKSGDAPDFYTSSLYKVQSGWVSYGAISPSYDYDRYRIDLGFGSGRYVIRISTDPVNRPLGEPWANAYGSLSIAVLDSFGLPIYSTSTIGGDASFTMDWNGFSDVGQYTLKLSGFSSTSYAISASPVSLANSAPVAGNATWVVDEDVLASSPLPVAIDAEGNSVTYSLVGTSSQRGLATVLASGTLIYQGPPDYNGPDIVQYKVTDSLGASNTYSVAITVRPLNDAPVAVGKSYAGPEDAPIVGTIGANDVDSPTVTLRITSQPRHGSVVLGANGAFTYSPNRDYSGADSFSFIANDGQADSTLPAVVTLNVSPINDPPVLSTQIPDMAATAKAPFTFIVLPNVFTDVDSATLALVATLADGSALPAWLTFNPATATFSGTPQAQNVGALTIRVTASDGSANASTSDTFVLSVLRGENSAPISAAGSGSTQEDSTLSATLPGATDPDGDSITFEKASDPSHGSVVVGPSGSYLYTPAANYSGADMFGFKISDGKGGVASYVMNLTVVSVPDTFVGTNDADILTGYRGADVYQLRGGNDTVTGGGGNDAIDGGAGLDTAVYEGPSSSYAVTRGASAWTVTDRTGAEGADTLTAVERVQFSDTRIALDLDGNAGVVGQVLRALVGPAALRLPLYVGYGLQAVDAGAAYASVVDLAISATPLSTASHRDFVRSVYRNVFGTDADAPTIDQLAGLLDSGALTKSAMGVIAAQHDANTLSVDLVGLANTGIEFVLPPS